jgi:hypothetical protein
LAYQSLDLTALVTVCKPVAWETVETHTRMETILGLLMMLILLIGGSCLFFLIFIQPIWGVVDVAVSKEHSGGVKAAVILLTLLLLGPIMTFFYACFGTRSRALRGSTLITFVVLLLSGGVMLGLAIAVPSLQQKLSWQTTAAGNARPPVTAPTDGPAEVEATSVDPETVPSFTAIHLARDGSSRRTAAVAEFDGHGLKPQSAQPVIMMPGYDPITHLAVDPQGPVYYGITTHEVGRIVSGTGRFEELKVTPGVSKPSWPSAIAFDSKQDLLLIAARSTGYSYNPSTGVWQELPWLKDEGIVGLAYDPRNELLYGLQRENISKFAMNLLQFNAKGALIATTVLSNPIPVGPYPSPRAQLVLAEDKLISIVYPSPETQNASVTIGCSIYLIDPRSGDCRRVRSIGVAFDRLEHSTNYTSRPNPLAEEQH